MCNCDCDRPDYDEEGEELWTDEIVIANLAIKCCECRYPIVKGEEFRRIEGCWDGEWAVYQMCLGCSAVSDRFTKEPGACHCLGGLYEELIDTEVLFRLKDDEGRVIRDERGERTWLTEASWLRVVNQNPLKCEVRS